MVKYVKLGPKASGGSFHCPITNLSVSGDQVSEMPTNASSSKLVTVALANNHIVEASKDEFNDYQKKEADRNKKGKKEAQQRSEVRQRSQPVQKSVIEDDDEDLEDDEETDEEVDDDDDDETDGMTKSQLNDALDKMEIPDEERKAAKSSEQLKALYKKYKGK